MARRVILHHPSISGKKLPATEALLAKSWVNVIKCDHRGRKCSRRIFGRAADPDTQATMGFKAIMREAAELSGN
jgi:hypothetical protein